ncbi:MAG: hypothetical protein JEZ11_08880 [Desulfobacterales bacterium]|nr:hypothetical protein [Desulfobacterales bacterium]
MADIIPLGTKLDEAQLRRAARRTKQKVRMTESVLRQTHDTGTCEKCGILREPRVTNTAEHKISIPYGFCAVCAGEYADFIDRIQGGGNPERYWQNATWRESWKRWIDYQGSMHSFKASKEFRRLVQEISTYSRG